MTHLWKEVVQVPAPGSLMMFLESGDLGLQIPFVGESDACHSEIQEFKY